MGARSIALGVVVARSFQARSPRGGFVSLGERPAVLAISCSVSELI
jgi:hypothetical protein